MMSARLTIHSPTTGDALAAAAALLALGSNRSQPKTAEAESLKKKSQKGVRVKRVDKYMKRMRITIHQRQF